MCKLPCLEKGFQASVAWGQRTGCTGRPARTLRRLRYGSFRRKNSYTEQALSIRDTRADSRK